MYQALYNKLRPQTFDEVIGQEHITTALKNQVINDRLSHAYLFIGTRGTGKTTCARILAKAVNCEHPVNGNPCCKCDACRSIAEGSAMDIVELDAASNNGVDNVRALREEAVFSPSNLKKRIYIIDEVHMLSMSAFNALLKILEEPPEHLMFILATTELQKVPATILSRCQRHTFKRIAVKPLASYLMTVASKEEINLQKDAALQISRLAEGGVRDALSILDQCSGHEKIDAETVLTAMGLAGNTNIAIMLDNILKRNTETVLKDFQDMWMNGKDPSGFLNELLTLVRDLLIFSVAPQSGADLQSGGYERAIIANFCSRMNKDEILAFMEIIQSAQASIKDTRTPRTSAELCLVTLCDLSLSDEMTAIKARLSRLEEAVAEGVPVQTAAVGRAEAKQCGFEREDEPETELSVPEFRDPEPDESKGPKEVIQSFEHETPAPVNQKYDSAEALEIILNKAAAKLNGPAAAAITDKNCCRLELIEGNLKISVAPGFYMERFKKIDIDNVFGTSLRDTLHNAGHVTLTEMSGNSQDGRSLDDLRSFKEVKFIR